MALSTENDAPAAVTAAVRDIAGAVFDCDGVLVDSERTWIDLMERYLGELGVVDIGPETMRGMTAAEAVTALERAVECSASLGGDSGDSGDGDGAAVVDGVPRRTAPTAAEVDRAYSAALAGLAAPMPGAQAFVRTLAGTIPIAVASNGRREDVLGLLDRAGMLGLFDVIVTIDDVENGKPAPDPYLLAARRLGIRPMDAVAFEDSILGSRAARAAGCTVVGVNEDLLLPLVADVRLGSLRELRFDPADSSLYA